MCLIVKDDPEEKGEVRPPTMPGPRIFEQGEPVEGPWRCASCYATRFKTMCFGQNDADATNCQHCGLVKSEAGWSLWMHYDDLPGG